MPPVVDSTDLLDELAGIYWPKKINVDKELFLPLAKFSQQIDCCVGYFTSGTLTELASAISCFLKSDESATLRIIASPNLEKKDIEVLEEALDADKNLLPLLFPDFEYSEDCLRSNCMAGLFYLIASGRLELKIAIQFEGLFHPKIYLFSTSVGGVAVHGSANSTSNGLGGRNTEHLSVERSWRHQDQLQKYEVFREAFTSYWFGDEPDMRTLELNERTLKAIKGLAEQGEAAGRTPRDLTDLIDKLVGEAEKEPIAQTPKQMLKVPDWLNYSDPPYSHQGEAVKSWQRNGYRGILSIATGGGKTLTSLVAATLLNQEVKKLLLVISLPTKPLLRQWIKDVEHFGVVPVSAYNKSHEVFSGEVKESIRRLKFGVSQSEVLLVLNNKLQGDKLAAVQRAADTIPTMLIGDEVHNLGSEGFIKDHPTYFKYHLGLSATHERQFDEDGTAFIESFFGDVVYEYPLSDAIGQCLVPYDYIPHRVYLTAEEEDHFAELTYKIRKLGFAVDLPDDDPQRARWQDLCLKRRRLIESASNKIEAINQTFPRSSADIKKTLIFCTNKNPEQMEQVNSMLSARGVVFHQVTQDETSRASLLNAVMNDFISGSMQVLTSKVVLDEGFNVPSVETAYLLASNTVVGRWTQRLGRVLRMSPETGKQKAVIHDFVALPQMIGDGASLDSDLKALVRSEIKRLAFFSELSTNGLESGGAMDLQTELLEALQAK